MGRSEPSDKDVTSKGKGKGRNQNKNKDLIEKVLALEEECNGKMSEQTKQFLLHSPGGPKEGSKRSTSSKSGS